MIAGIMQPYFFPYLGYFDLICRADEWVVFDITQYTPKSWMTRNRILHPSQGWQYINVPIHKHSGRQPIYSILLADKKKCLNHIVGQLGHYKKYAPNYFAVTRLVEGAFSATNTDSLVELNVNALRGVCAYLDIHFAPIIASQSNLPFPPIEHAGQWALEICTIIGADAYINPPGGRDLFRPEEFYARGIKLMFSEMPSFTYDCRPYAFETHLSIIDVLMWNSPQQVRDYLVGTKATLDCGYDNKKEGSDAKSISHSHIV